MCSIPPFRAPHGPASVSDPPAPPVDPVELLAWAETLPHLVLRWSDAPVERCWFSAGFPGLGGGVLRLPECLRGDPSGLLCFLSHELGHYFTFDPYGASRGNPRHHRRWAAETLADRWAADLLIPPGGVWAGDTAADVAERWGLTAAFAQRLLPFWRRDRGEATLGAAAGAFAALAVTAASWLGPARFAVAGPVLRSLVTVLPHLGTALGPG